MEITDPRRLRALAHPLRLDLIEALGVHGARTAAECAKLLDSTQASCSFHLRQLAKFGYVEEAKPRGDGRERPWRLTDIEQSWSSEAGPAAEQLERVFVQREADRIVRWVEGGKGEPSRWRNASFLVGMTLPLTSDELSEVGEALRAVLEPFIERLSEGADRTPESRPVRVLLSAVPLAEGETGPAQGPHEDVKGDVDDDDA